MGWFSILPENLSTLELWVARIFVSSISTSHTLGMNPDQCDRSYSGSSRSGLGLSFSHTTYFFTAGDLSHTKSQQLVAEPGENSGHEHLVLHNGLMDDQDD